MEPDRFLVGRVLAGDEQAARELYDAHVTRIHRLIYRLAGETELARDLTQDTFIRAFDRLRQYRGAVPLGAWLRAIAISVTFNALRRRRRIGRHEVTLEHATAVTGSAGSSAELKLRLASAIGSLPERLRVVFVMHDVEGFTHPEIAETLDIPV
ncbi:MAG TPA: RNA polymerase sigma factor, partial [Vicinamibacteria bacterium]|nr:RNA polymerase sigma factor [Vicinamibacteria bacterium]